MPSAGTPGAAPGTVFVALPDLPEHSAAFGRLLAAFSDVRVATHRDRALTELTALGPAVTAAVVGVRERVGPAVLDALPGLRVLGSVGTGTDHLDLAALRKRGVRVVTTPGVNAVSVAEHAMMMALALAKRALPGHQAALTGEDRAGLPEPPVELRGRCAGVLGAGATARALLPLLRAFGMETLVWTRTPENHADLPTAPLEEIFRRAHVISVHLPLHDSTRGLIGPRLLGQLPPGAMVVNTARKEILDISALPEMAAARPDLRFGIDDFGLAADGTAAALGASALFSPHVAGVTTESLAAMQETAVRRTVDLITAPPD